MIQIKSPKSDIFEEAYFILKDSDYEAPTCDIVREAERLLSESESGARHRLAFGWDEIAFFLAGVFLSVLFFGGNTGMTLMSQFVN